MTLSGGDNINVSFSMYVINTGIKIFKKKTGYVTVLTICCF
jgi:hypothetical protein